MNSEHKHIIHKIIAYFKGTLPPKEQHDLEKKAAADPFLQDAMEGLNRLTPEELENDLQVFKQKLTTRTNKKSRKLLPYLRVAAGIILIAGLGSLIFYTLNPIKKELALQQHDEAIEKERLSVPIEQKVQDLKPKERVQKSIPDRESGTVQEPAPVKQEKTTPTKATPKTLAKTEPPKAATASTKAKKEPLTTLEDDMEIMAEEDMEMEKMEVQPMAMEEEPVEEETVSYALTSAPPSQRIISGTVYNSDDNLPLPGVSVVVENSKQGTITDVDGQFRLKNPKDSILTFAFIGMEEQKVNINQTFDTAITVNMQQSMLALEEVVVVNYDKKKQSRARSRRTVEMETSGNQLQGQVAGVSTKNQHKFQHITSIKYPQTTEKNAEPKGGFKKLDKYLERNIKSASLQGITQEIKVEIAQDGSLGNFQNLNYTQEAVFNKVVELLKQGPDWRPAEQDNAGIKSKVVLILTF